MIYDASHAIVRHTEEFPERVTTKTSVSHVVRAQSNTSNATTGSQLVI